MVISGHRRLMALKGIGKKNVDCRLTKFENTTIATIELNRYRQKSTNEIKNEIETLDGEYKKDIPRGRPLKGEIRKLNVSSMEKVAKSLGVSLTKAKKRLNLLDDMNRNYYQKLTWELSVFKRHICMSRRSIKTKI